MKTNQARKNSGTDAVTLRHKAEELFKKKQIKAGLQLTESEMQNLIQELGVYQIELELQNEELELAKEQAEVASQKYTELYDLAPSGYFTLSDKGEIIELNLFGAQMLGKERSRLKNSMFGFFVSDETKPTFSLFLRKVFSGNAKESCEVALSENGNSTMYVHLTGIVIGNGQQCLISATDISQRKQAEEERLENSEERFRLLYENAKIGLYRTTPNGTIALANKALVSMLGYQSFDELAKRNVEQDGFETPNQRKAFLEKIEQTGEIENFESTWIRQDRTPVFVKESALAIRDAIGNTLYYDGTVEDITERRRMEEALRDSEARYRLLFETSADGILIADIETETFKYANPAMCQMLGYTEIELTTLGLADIHPKQDLQHVTAEFESQARGEKILAPDMPCLRKDGNILYADINTSTITMDGRACMVGLFRDISERKQAAEALKYALERNHRQQEVVTSVAISPQLAAGDVQSLAHQLNEHAAKAVDVERVSVWLFNDKGNELKCVDLYEQSADCHSAGVVLLKNEYKNEFEALQNTKYIDSNDPLTDPRIVGYVEGYLKPLRITSMLDAAIRDGNRSIGVLCFEHVGKKHNWEPDEIAFASQLADQIAIAVLNQERIHAEELLKSSEERYRIVADFTYDWEYWLSPDGSFLYNSPSCKRITGYSPEEFKVIPELLTSIIHPDDRLMIIEHLRVPMDSEDICQQEFRILSRNNQEYWIEHICQPVFSAEGHFLGRRASNRDITVRKQAETELQKAHENLKRTLRFEEALLSAIPTPVFYKDKEGRYLGCNRAFTEFMGVTPEEIKGKTVDELWPSKNAQVYHTHDLDLMRNPAPQIYEFKVRDKDGLERPVIYSKDVFRDDNDQVAGIVGAFLDITERKQAEEALRNSEQRYRLLVETANEGILVAQNGFLKFVNPITQMITGFTHEELLTLPFIDFIYPEDREIVISNHLKRLNGDQFLPRYQFRIAKKDGSTRKIEMNGIVIEWEGQPATLNMLTDITERTQAEETLQHERTLLRLLIDNVPDLMYTKDTAGRKTLVNIADVQNMGVKLESEVLGKDDFAFFPKEMAEKFYTDDQSVIQTGQPLINKEEYTLNELGQGRWFLTSKFPLRDQGGQIIGLAGIGRDITERKKTEDKLRESEERFRHLFELSPEAIMLIDPYDTNVDWPIVDCNETACKMNGYTLEELIGKSIDIVNTTAGTPKEREEYLENLRHAPVIHLETLHRHRDGHIFPIDVSASIVTFQGREMLLGIDRDITERKQAEEEIQHKNQQLLKLNTEKDKFFSIISHDLRSPFSGFLGLTELMAEDLPSLTMDEIQKFSVNMRNSATNLYRLLENLLQWSRMQQGSIPFDPEVIQLRSIVDESIVLARESAKNKGIDLTSNIPENLEVFGDNNMLQTVIRNLVSNALKFTHKGGKISVSATANDDKNIEIAVKDTGIGMTSEMVNNLFRLDVKTNRKGTEDEPSTGLGLLLCKEFVEKLGGRIWVESKEGNLEAGKAGGTTFYFTLRMST